MYSAGASESRLGDLSSDNDVIIATKFPAGFFSHTQDMPEALKASLERLGRGMVDLYQHHFPSKRVSIPQLTELMADAVEAGKIKAVGVSNYSAEQMRIAHSTLEKRGIPLASNQVEYSLLHRQPEVNGVLETCRELEITLIAYMPLASGALTGKYIPGAKPRGFRRYMKSFRRKGLEKIVPVTTLLRSIGDRYSKNPGQVALRWLIERENVLPIPGAKNGRQAAENADALSFSLTPEEIDTIDRATLDWRT
jgi:aryl-alcohol dehydrogenase-like predicted oxidoreductase